MKSPEIHGRRKVFVIAEIGSTHDGSVGVARNSIEVAAKCGVDGVKFQTHLAGAESTASAPPPPFFQEESRFNYFTRTGFGKSEWLGLRKHAERSGVAFLSSPFSIEAVWLLEEIGVEQYKIPSGEVTNLPLIEEVARTGKRILLSSGMSTWCELDAAVNTILKKNEQLVVLQCTSLYPCPYGQVGLNIMREMADRYGKPVGLSDHTLTNVAAFAAVALGASVVEKHFALSRHLYGSDAKYSTEPLQFQELVDGIRAIETIIGSPVDKDDIVRLLEMRKVFQKSVVSLVEIPSGAIITSDMVGIKKPGTGLPPSRIGDVVGKRAARSVPPDTVLVEEDIMGLDRA